MVKKLFHGVAMLALINLFAVVGMVGYLFASGRLNEERINQIGKVLVKGPNVMRGYLGRDDLTASVVRDGWYTTGDIAIVDERSAVPTTRR